MRGGLVRRRYRSCVKSFSSDVLKGPVIGSHYDEKVTVPPVANSQLLSSDDTVKGFAARCYVFPLHHFPVENMTTSRDDTLKRREKSYVDSESIGQYH